MGKKQNEQKVKKYSKKYTERGYELKATSARYDFC